jgi:putative acetyltransferase
VRRIPRKQPGASRIIGDQFYCLSPASLLLAVGMLYRIVPYGPQHRAAFAAINRQWLERLFAEEPTDTAILEDPETHILAPGGQIWIAETPDGEAIGTAGLMPDAPHAYQLVKMGVLPAHQGKGVAKALLGAALDWARAHQAQRVFLLSVEALTPAITLYRNHGFEVTHRGPHPLYARADIGMELVLEQAA